MAESYKQHPPDGDYDAIVIGSGIGGLTVASLLARLAERRVLVLERHYAPGGFTHTFKRRGYEWDVGVHDVGEIESESGLEALLDTVTGGHVRWQRLPECYDRVILGDRAYDLIAGREAFVEHLSARFPGEGGAIREYLDLCHRATRAGAPTAIDKALPGWLSAVIGSALRAPLHRWSDRTLEAVLRPRVKSDDLYGVLTAQCGDYGLPPSKASFLIHAMVANHFIDGGYYPVGGPSTIAEGAERVIAAAGGAVRTNAEVEAILVEDGRAVGVRMVDGAELRARVVISDAGAPITYGRLLPREVADRTGLPAKIRAVGPSTGHLCLHLGFRHTDEALGLDGTNLWIYPDGDREEAFARFEQDPEAPLPLAYASFPSAKDPSFEARYPGRATVEVITLAPMDHFEAWRGTKWMKRGDHYEALKARLGEKLLEALFRQRPQLRGKVDHAELSTPLSTKRFTGHPHGEMYGLAHTPPRFRLPLRAQTPVPGLYLTGADLVACGVGGALISGAICAAALLRRHPFTLARRWARGRLAPSSRPALATGEP